MYHHGAICRLFSPDRTLPVGVNQLAEKIEGIYRGIHEGGHNDDIWKITNVGTDVSGAPLYYAELKKGWFGKAFKIEVGQDLMNKAGMSRSAALLMMKGLTPGCEIVFVGQITGEYSLSGLAIINKMSGAHGNQSARYDIRLFLGPGFSSFMRRE